MDFEPPHTEGCLLRCEAKHCELAPSSKPNIDLDGEYWLRNDVDFDAFFDTTTAY